MVHVCLVLVVALAQPMLATHTHTPTPVPSVGLLGASKHGGPGTRQYHAWTYHKGTTVSQMYGRPYNALEGIKVPTEVLPGQGHTDRGCRHIQ